MNVSNKTNWVKLEDVTVNLSFCDFLVVLKKTLFTKDHWFL